MTEQALISQLAAQYRDLVQSLAKNKDSPPPKDVFACLVSRDKIAHLWQKQGPPDPAAVHLIDEGDSQLRKLKGPISQLKELDGWRKNFTPPQQAWWWHFQAPGGKWQRFDWLTTAIALIFLTLAAGLIADIAPRFLSGGPDAKGAMIVVLQTGLVLLTTSSVLTKTGQEMGRRILGSLNISRQYWQEIAAGVAVIICLALFLFHLYLPQMAVSYNDAGLVHHCAGQLTSAKFSYERALKLNPDYLEAHYNLGQLYEDLQDFKPAQTHYQIALQGGLTAAYNNLARLYILEENYNAAVPLLLIALQRVAKGDTRAEHVRCQPDPDKAGQEALVEVPIKELQYELLKNLGWARLGQARYNEAEIHLQEAIDLRGDAAPAYCLLAQVREGLEAPDGVLEDWENCLRYASRYEADEDAWIGLARQRLQAETNPEGDKQ